jgi:hypothetical protein
LPLLRFLSLENISRIFNRADGHAWMSERIDDARSRGVFYSANVAEGISDYVGDDPKLRNDIRKTVSTRLQIWTFPQIAGVTARSDFDLRDLRRKPMTVYVVVSPGMIPTLRPLLRLFFDQAIALNTDTIPGHDPSLKYQCLFMMDEFTRLVAWMRWRRPRNMHEAIDCVWRMCSRTRPRCVQFTAPTRRRISSTTSAPRSCSAPMIRR